MEEKKRTIDRRLEQKIGFDRIRNIISDRCSTAYAAERTATETFSTNPSHIRKRLLLTDEMRLIMMFEDSFPSGGFIDCIDFLKPLERSSAAIDLLSLRKLKTMLEIEEGDILLRGHQGRGISQPQEDERAYNGFP